MLPFDNILFLLRECDLSYNRYSVCLIDYTFCEITLWDAKYKKFVLSFDIIYNTCSDIILIHLQILEHVLWYSGRFWDRVVSKILYFHELHSDNRNGQ